MSSASIEIPTVITTTLRDAIKSGQSDEWFILDVRTTAEFNEGHIPGAINLPLDDMRGFLKELHTDHGKAKIAVVCRTGKRACTAHELLEDAQFENASVLHGGMVEWMKAGCPVEKGKGGISIERQVRITAGLMALTFGLLGALYQPLFALGAAFIGGGLAFAGITDTCGMAKVLMLMPFNRIKKSAGKPWDRAG